MKKFLPSLVFVLAACYLSAQQQGVTLEPAKTQIVPVADPLHHDEHDGHDHSHDVVTPDSAKAPNPNAPKIIFKEDSYYFGDIPEGPPVTHEFKFTNTGKEPLILANVRASCGCTTPSWTKEPVLPGKEGSILVTYSTSGRVGTFSKMITITSNADIPNKVIDIKGDVIKAEPEKSVPVEQPSMLSPR